MNLPLQEYVLPFDTMRRGILLVGNAMRRFEFDAEIKFVKGFGSGAEGKNDEALWYRSVCGNL